MDHNFSGDLAIVLSVGAITSYLAKLIKQPPIFGHMIAGILIGPYLFEPFASSLKSIPQLSHLGVILVMFSVGLEFRINKLLGVLPISGVTGIIQISTLSLAAVVIAKLFGCSTLEAIFLATSISISSTMVVSSVFERSPPEMDTKHFVFGILIIQDLVAIIMLTLLGAKDILAEPDMAIILPTGVKLLSLLTFIFTVGIIFIPRIIKKISLYYDNDLMVVMTMGICFGISLLVEKSGFSVALGAFLAGILVAESGESSIIENLISPIKNLFAAIFFISIGMTLNPKAAIEYLPHSMGLSIVIIMLHFFAVGISGVLSGNNLRKSIKAGLSLGQIGEFSFLIMGIGVASGVVRPLFQPLIITTSILTSLITPILWKYSDHILGMVDQYLPKRIRMLVTLYENWFEKLRMPGARNSKLKIPRKVVISVMVDGLILILIPPTIVNFLPNLNAFFQGRGITLYMTQFILLTLGAAIFIPLAVNLTKNTAIMATLLKENLFPNKRRSNSLLTMHATKIFQVTCQLLLFLIVGLPLVTAIQPFTEGIIFSSVLLGGFIYALYYLWTRSGRMEDEISTGAHEIIDLMSRRNHHLKNSKITIPGLEKLTVVTIQTDSKLIGMTLLELDLPTHSGANIVILERANGDTLIFPEPHFEIQKGDKFFLYGNEMSQKKAEGYLLNKFTLKKAA
jgi:monovalent cation:H+ antiporter-2, CPA2 family